MQLERLNAHRDWANDLLIAWIADAFPAGEPDDYCLRMLTHVLTSEAVWLGRLRGEAPPKPSGEPLPAAGLAALRLAHAPEWEAALADPERLFHYRNFAGTACESTAAEIVTHVCMHGQYHRGQVAAQAARIGLKCPSTDFILFARWL
jgi:uncharacterized damage-inducible protein DinB